MICLFHRTDFDGKCAGAIVKYRFPSCRLYGIDYADKFDVTRIKEGEDVVMVDFTLENFDEMESLLKRCGTFIWIDHHKTYREVEKQITEHPDLFDPLGIRQVSSNLDDPDGEIKANRISACELTWKYFFSERRIPYAVWLLGRYDIWEDDHPLWKSEMLPFQYGMRLVHAHPGEQDFWEPFFKTDESSELIKAKIIEGNAALKYDENLSERIAQLWFPIEFKGFKFQAINRSHGNSLSGQSIWDPKNYDAIMYFCKGPHTWRITMFTDKEGIDLYPLAKSLDGGGHSQACGFTTKNIMELIPQLIEF